MLAYSNKLGWICRLTYRRDKTKNTAEPLVSDYPKCQAEVVTYGRWSLTRNKTITAITNRNFLH